MSDEIILGVGKGFNFRAKKGNFKGSNNPRFGCHLTDETKKKISEANKLRVRTPHSEETKQKMSLAHKTSKNLRIHSETLKKTRQTARYDDAWKQKISKSLQEYFRIHKMPVRSPETCTKLSNALKGRVFTAEHCKRISETMTRKCIEHPELMPNAILARRGGLSKAQMRLFELVKAEVGDNIDVQLNFMVRTKTWRFIDVAVPSVKLGFEFNGKRWHQDVSKDVARDKELTDLGWTIAHIDEKGLKYIAPMDVMPRCLRCQINL